ncbi:hypothetical protein MNB_SUP05-9-246 [hydrothermal vent metagenome]|uniref:Uncharacterized protein n=1 Tax=hydrothermal vent metagenome TaxID=652676 RepID=A0A1W1DQZ5_9ZZZZ
MWCLKSAKIAKKPHKIKTHSLLDISSVFLNENTLIPSRKFRA